MKPGDKLAATSSLGIPLPFHKFAQFWQNYGLSFNFGPRLKTKKKVCIACLHWAAGYLQNFFNYKLRSEGGKKERKEGTFCCGGISFERVVCISVTLEETFAQT